MYIGTVVCKQLNFKAHTQAIVKKPVNALSL